MAFDSGRPIDHPIFVNRDRFQPRVAHNDEPVPFLCMLDDFDGGGLGKSAGSKAFALPEVRDDLEYLNTQEDAPKIFGELRSFVERCRQRGHQVETKELELHWIGDLGDLDKFKLDVKNRGESRKPRYRVVIKPDGVDFTIISVANRKDTPSQDGVYKLVRMRMGRLPGFELRDLPAGDEHVSITFQVNDQQLTQLWNHFEIVQDPNECKGIGRSERFWPDVAVTLHPVEPSTHQNGHTNSLTFISYVAYQREVDQAIKTTTEWLDKAGIDHQQS